MSKYNHLLKVLEVIRTEAPAKYKRYYPKSSEIEKLNQSYSRAYIHLFLKVRFGILDFEEREHFITDNSNDGGIRVVVT